jgi:hypothetical protein
MYIKFINNIYDYCIAAQCNNNSVLNNIYAIKQSLRKT